MWWVYACGVCGKCVFVCECVVCTRGWRVCGELCVYVCVVCVGCLCMWVVSVWCVIVCVV